MMTHHLPYIMNGMMGNEGGTELEGIAAISSLSRPFISMYPSFSTKRSKQIFAEVHIMGVLYYTGVCVH